MKDKYDVAIIGSGIGGLVCGCYLAKEGKKVLVAEQHDKPGGYCTSFKRDGYTFDSAVDYLGSCREGDGIIFNTLKDLSLLDKVKFIKPDIQERIIIPKSTVFIRTNKERTRQELKYNFPKEKENIDRFFDFVLAKDFLLIYSKTKSLTFDKLLTLFFHDPKLKSILSILIGNLGVPPSKASALVSIVLFREHILDGGYYPKGGIQKFSNLLAEKLKELGGELLLSYKVKKILTKNKVVTGIELDDDKIIRTNSVVSNADATKTFKELLSLDCIERKKVNNLEVSSSTFIVYLGINQDLNKIMERHLVSRFFFTYDINDCYDTKHKYILEKFCVENKKQDIGYLTCHFPTLIDNSLAPSHKSIIRASIWIKSSDGKISKNSSEILYRKIIRKINTLIPNIENKIIIKEIATPDTLEKFTLNRSGAAFGWSAIPKQVDKNIFPSETSIKGLYLTGHWVTSGIGQSGVALVALGGKNLAKALTRASAK